MERTDNGGYEREVRRTLHELLERSTLPDQVRRRVQRLAEHGEYTDALDFLLDHR